MIHGTLKEKEISLSPETQRAKELNQKRPFVGNRFYFLPSSAFSVSVIFLDYVFNGLIKTTSNQLISQHFNNIKMIINLLGPIKYFIVSKWFNFFQNKKNIYLNFINQKERLINGIRSALTMFSSTKNI